MLRILADKAIDNLIGCVVTGIVALVALCWRRRWWPRLRAAIFRIWNRAMVMLHLRHIETEAERVAREEWEMSTSDDPALWKKL